MGRAAEGEKRLERLSLFVVVVKGESPTRARFNWGSCGVSDDEEALALVCECLMSVFDVWVVLFAGRDGGGEAADLFAGGANPAAAAAKLSEAAPGSRGVCLHLLGLLADGERADGLRERGHLRAQRLDLGHSPLRARRVR
jgi:hypothetical protein